jgi:hypothetical protein
MSGAEHVSRLLAAERGVSPPAGTAEVELQRLLGSLALQAAPLPVAVGSLKLGWSLLAKWVGVGFAVGMAGAGAASVAVKASPETRLVDVPGVSLAAPSQVRAATPATPRALPAPGASAPEVPALSSSGRRPAAAAELPAAPSAPPGLDEELRLIAAAKRELDQGRGHLARVWLDEHRQRFPAGVFGLEREGLLVLAACSAGQNASLARDFAKWYPASPMLAQIERRCGAQASSAAQPPALDNFSGGDK